MRRALAALAVVGLAACGSNPTGPSQLQVEDLVVGTGATAAAGDTLTVDYVGTFLDGAKFDSSIDRGQPFVFTLGRGAVIAGWDQGIPGMRVGGTRKLTIPPSLAYGDKDYGGIPGNSTLVFQIQLRAIAGK